MAAARPCRRCRNLFIPRSKGRPPVLCPVCRSEKGLSGGSDDDTEPEFWQRMREEVRGRAGDALEDAGHPLHVAKETR